MAAGLAGVYSDPFQMKINQTINTIVFREDVMAGAKSALVYKPLTNFVTLGIYSLISSNE